MPKSVLFAPPLVTLTVSTFERLPITVPAPVAEMLSESSPAPPLTMSSLWNVVDEETMESIPAEPVTESVLVVSDQISLYRIGK